MTTTQAAKEAVEQAQHARNVAAAVLAGVLGEALASGPLLVLKREELERCLADWQAANAHVGVAVAAYLAAAQAQVKVVGA